MSQEKAQLIAPQGHFTVPGLNVAGVVTASSFSGNCTGTASSLAQGSNVVVGVMTASSFAGDVFGNAAGLSTTTAGLKLGIVTSTSFAGNFTGIGSGLTGTPNIVAGLVTASQFVGNTPGLAAGLSAGKNLAAGIITATTFFGDGSNLTGAGSTAYIRQSVGSGTTIDLNNGNIIYFTHVGDTTVSFANTSTAEDVTFIRPLNSTNISYCTRGFVGDGTGDSLTLASTSHFDFGTGDFTIETWCNLDLFDNYPYIVDFRVDGNDTGTTNKIVWYFRHPGGSTGKLSFWLNGEVKIDSETFQTGQWIHAALVRSSGVTKMYINGTKEGASFTDTTDYGSGGSPLIIAQRQGFSGQSLDGVFSNFRIVKGRALYTSNFIPPSSALTNVSGTVLLCCQSDSSTTTAAVTPGTITANGNPTAAAQTIALTLPLGSTLTWPDSITWNGGSAPTLAASSSSSLTGQVFNLVTYNGGTNWYGYEEVNRPDLNQLWSAGLNNHGQLGLNNTNNQSSPIQIPGTTWSKVKGGLGSGYTFGAVKQDGTLWTWGRNQKGELGQNNTTSYSSPVQIPGTTWNNYSASYCVGLATKTDGTLWTWGRGTHGELGQNNRTEYSSPVQIPGTNWNTTKLNAGSATKTDGTLWTWGFNQFGNLAQNTTGPGNRVSSPTQVPGTTWVEAATVGTGGMGIKTDGTLWMWGHNANRVLGQSNDTNYSSPVQIPGTNWNKIATSNLYNFAAVYAGNTSGQLYSWGHGGFSALGQNSTSDITTGPQIIGSDTTWDIINVGGWDAHGAIKTDGTLWTWGLNGQGQMMQNNTTSYSSPRQVGSDTGYTGISASYRSMIVSKKA